jgi:uncharacterized protein YbjT (DUF2867 family)
MGRIESCPIRSDEMLQEQRYLHTLVFVLTNWIGDQTSTCPDVQCINETCTNREFCAVVKMTVQSDISQRSSDNLINHASRLWLQSTKIFLHHHQSMSTSQPAILVVGATGNTGKNVVRTLSSLLPRIPRLSTYQILAQTRNASSSAAQTLSRLPNVKIVEEFWPKISAEWLQARKVRRAFIASHNEPQQFPEETAFHLAARDAGVEYVVRISTTAVNVKPDYPSYYPRQHWAVEQFLEAIAPVGQTDAMKWTSLQPMGFTDMYLSSAVTFVKDFSETGIQGKLRLIPDEHALCAPIDCDEVGAFAAHLIAQEDVSKHHTRRYIMNGPVDITGREIVKMVEEYIGQEVKQVSFRDMEFLDGWAAQDTDKAHFILSIKYAPVLSWAGLTRARDNSPEISELLELKSTPAMVFDKLIKKV